MRNLNARLVELGARVILQESSPHAPIAIDPSADQICAMGGDGTLRHVAAAVARSGRNVPISVYPAGTINLVHREMGTPVDLSTFALALVHGTDWREHYTVALNDTLFLACASCGPDSRAVARVAPGSKRWMGRLAYAAAMVRLIFDWQRPEILLRHDGEQIACEAFYVAKGRYFAGPWSFAPAACLSQPSLRVIALRRARRRDYLRFMWTVWRGMPLEGWSNAVVFDCSRLEADGDRSMPVQADGDIVGKLPAMISINPRSLRFC